VPLRWWARALLVTAVLLLVGVFAIAIYIDPYSSDGTAQMEETHRQLGLPPCTFRFATGVPCPSCGMTTSFALLIRGDVWNSLRANAAGTLLAAFCLLFIPWALMSAWRGYLAGVVSLERTLTRLVIVFVTVLLVRWVVVLLALHPWR
jgi:hypothetical protein